MLQEPTEYEVGKTILYFIRHGDRGSGEHDIELPGPGLTELGVTQATAIAAQLETIKSTIDAFYTSPMARAKETAAIITPMIGRDPKIVAQLIELGKDDAIPQESSVKIRRQFALSIKAFDELLEKHRGQVILFVGHGHVFRRIIARKLGLKPDAAYRLDMVNCSVTKLRFDGIALDYIYYWNSSVLPESLRVPIEEESQEVVDVVETQDTVVPAPKSK